jgi:hypothetical protein
LSSLVWAANWRRRGLHSVGRFPGLEAIAFAYDAEWAIDAAAPGIYDFVALPERAQVIPLLRSCFPGGSAVVETARGQEPLFSAYEVSIQQPASCSGD